MILKVKVPGKQYEGQENDEFWYWDNISCFSKIVHLYGEALSTRVGLDAALVDEGTINSDEPKSVWLAQFRQHTPNGSRAIEVAFDSIAYLMNDNGDTIEIITPA